MRLTCCKRSTKQKNMTFCHERLFPFLRNTSRGVAKFPQTCKPPRDFSETLLHVRECLPKPQIGFFASADGSRPLARLFSRPRKPRDSSRGSFHTREGRARGREPFFKAENPFRHNILGFRPSTKEKRESYETHIHPAFPHPRAHIRLAGLPAGDGRRARGVCPRRTPFRHRGNGEGHPFRHEHASPGATSNATGSTFFSPMRDGFTIS